MQNDSRTILSNSPTTRKFTSSTRKSFTTMNRISRIKDKRTIFPQSTLSKIVFISNMDGTGFRRQNFYAYDIPGQLDLEQMIRGVNKACYEQWKKTFNAMEEEPFQRWFTAQKVFAALIIVITVLFIDFVLVQLSQYMDLLVYAFVTLVLIGCVSSLIIIKQRRVEINKDTEMVYAIKKQLIRLNQNELQQYQNSRFTWTCHRDCLWISCEFH